MADGSAADKAYQAALREIERVRAAGEHELKLNGDAYAGLDRIPPEVATIVGLRVLSLDERKVSDLTPLRNLTALQGLYLDGTAVTDLSPLRDLTKLRNLSLNRTAVSDLTPLRGITELQSLWLRQTGVTDLSPLLDLTALYALALDQTDVSDLLPLRRMTALKSLTLNQTAVSDLSPLRGMTALEFLALDQTAVTDLSPLRDLTTLRFLQLEQTAVSDLSPLRGLTALDQLGLSHTAVSDLSPLRDLTSLQSLWLKQTAVGDLSPLRHHISLERIWLDQTAVSDLRPIADLLVPKSGRRNFVFTFIQTRATALDPELRRLSEIEDHDQRTHETLAYLRTLPPWPEPYTPATRGDATTPGQIGPSENYRTSKIARKEPPMSRGAIKAKTSAAHIRFLQREPEVTQLTAQSVAAQIREAMQEMRRRSNDIPDALLEVESLADALDGIGNTPLGPKGEKRIEDLQLHIAQLEAVIEKLTADLTASKAAIANPNGFSATLSKEAAREIATTLGFLTRLGAIAGLVYFIGPTNPVATGLIGAWAAITKLVK